MYMTHQCLGSEIGQRNRHTRPSVQCCGAYASLKACLSLTVHNQVYQTLDLNTFTGRCAASDKQTLG